MHRITVREIVVKTLLTFVVFAGLPSYFSFAASDIEITDAWVRETPPGTSITAAYMTITNNGTKEDTLVGVSTEAAESVEIHKSVLDDNGVAKMNMLSEVPIPPSKSVELGPGSMHIMLIGLKKPLKNNEKVLLELEFEGAGKLKVPTEIRGIQNGSGHNSH